MRLLVVCMVLCVSVVTSFASVQFLSPEEEQYLLNNPEIRFISQSDNPPFVYRDNQWEEQGMCIELIRWMSTESGFQAVFINMTSQEARQALLNGKADVIASFSYSQNEDSLFDFTEAVFETPTRIFVKSGTSGILSVADLSDRAVAVQTGNYAVDVLSGEELNCSIVQTDDLNNAIQLLIDGEVDALIGEEHTVEFSLLTSHSQGEIIAVGDAVCTGFVCMAVAQEDSVLCSVLNKGIGLARGRGIIDGIEDKWQDNFFPASSEFRHGVRFLVLAGLILVLVILVFLRNFRLRHIVEQRTISMLNTERKLDEALDQANLALWDFNLVTGELLHNNRYSLMLGYDPGEMDYSLSGWTSQLHPDDRKAAEAYMNEFLKQGGERFENEYRMKIKGGGWVYIRSIGGVTERDNEGQPVRLSGIHQDITRIKRSENMARQAIEDWEETFNALPELIAVLNSEGIITKVNRAQAVALGLTKEECTGRELCALMFPDDPEKQSKLQGYIKSGIKQAEPVEMYIEKYKGNYEERISFYKDPRDGSGRIIHIARDVTTKKEAEKKQKEMEQKIQYSQKLESLGVLAGGIAHDFNNILMSIRGYTDLAVSCVDVNSQAYSYMEKINESVKKASELSGQMLAYSGKGNFVIETVYINEIIEKMKPMLSVSISHKAGLQFHLGHNLPCIKVDSAQMEQVILNLVTNASEAIGSSPGEITVTTGLEKTLPPGKQETSQTESSYIFIQVDDTGSGMSDQVMEKLFEPFFTTRFTGRGLGMAVVHGIVEGHNGFIKVSSKLGIGSSLKVFIPASEEIAAESDESTESKTAEKAAAGILLVDDDKNILFIGKHTLKKTGYTVFTAGDGQEAVEVYRQNKDAIQCVILDLTMPVMDGVECLRELKRFDPSVKVILTSGYNQQEVEDRILLRDIAGYLKKPYGLSVLRAEVRKVVRGLS